MDWSNVTVEELGAALAEVEWNSPPRPLSEFFTKFTPPKNQSKWSSRVKCNIYYYRTNYLVVVLLGYIAAFIRNPFALLGLANALLGALMLNDSFARAFSEKIMRAVRKVNPRLAQKMRAASAPGGSTLGAGPADRTMAKSDIKVAGVNRLLIATLLMALAFFVCYWSQAILTLSLGTILGACAVLAHASFRSPNLKARLASAREEFRAVWRGYGEFSHDYTL
mmetsp:Transcript_39831/g.113006  ORF Transcript_39831/g.113006 Transcript_39831/m.113006 type:complete len:223 (-) Transcript_39831:16-684(-)